ncbi:hypothetical protein FLK61_37765 [Paenalkalicoccus suaedae]|uniref:Uncharacterized protein n=1 Tax=Paenalkalicoccus suaedae TaxID=2592382 RepID=A0A859FGX6_9BACI|nr:hypothetical protein [Paenalkalicoccus suaedae]QKS72377.1 hypothetical protein FLK61_37765 [Paenalkalicoccus suaedae]
MHLVSIHRADFTSVYHNFDHIPSKSFPLELLYKMEQLLHDAGNKQANNLKEEFKAWELSVTFSSKDELFIVEARAVNKEPIESKRISYELDRLFAKRTATRLIEHYHNVITPLLIRLQEQEAMDETLEFEINRSTLYVHSFHQFFIGQKAEPTTMVLPVLVETLKKPLRQIYGDEWLHFPHKAPELLLEVHKDALLATLLVIVEKWRGERHEKQLKLRSRATLEKVYLSLEGFGVEGMLDQEWEIIVKQANELGVALRVDEASPIIEMPLISAVKTRAWEKYYL